MFFSRYIFKNLLTLRQIYEYDSFGYEQKYIFMVMCAA